MSQLKYADPARCAPPAAPSVMLHKDSAALGLLLAGLLCLVYHLSGVRHFKEDPRPWRVYAQSTGELRWTASDAAGEGIVIAGSALPGGWRGLLLGIPLDVGTAGLDDWESLPSIGPNVAREIVTTRERLGGFTGTRDILKVKGIGEKRLAALSPWLKADGTNGNINEPEGTGE